MISNRLFFQIVRKSNGDDFKWSHFKQILANKYCNWIEKIDFGSPKRQGAFFLLNACFVSNTKEDLAEEPEKETKPFKISKMRRENKHWNFYIIDDQRKSDFMR